jgi:hypothetical protein
MCSSETHNKLLIGEPDLSTVSYSHSSKQGDALSPIHANTKAQTNQDGLELNGTYQLMFYVRGAQESCTRAVHCASVRTGCVEPAPPTITQQADHLSLSLRVRSPSPPIADTALPSPATCRAVPSRARVHGTAEHIIAHCALCTARAPQFYVQGMNLLGKNEHHNINAEAPLAASTQMVLEANAQKATYMFMFRHQNATSKYR